MFDPLSILIYMSIAGMVARDLAARAENDQCNAAEHVAERAAGTAPR